MIEIYVCVGYDPHSCFSSNDVNGLRFLLLTKLSDNKLRKLPLAREALKPHILCSAYVVGWKEGVALQPSDEIPFPFEYGWKYSKYKRFVIDWC